MLNRHEKLAVFNLALAAIGILLFFLIWQTMGITKAYGGFAVFAFQVVGHLLYLRKKNTSDIVEDERDISIRLKSQTGSFSLVFVYFVIASLAIYYTHLDAGVVSVDLFILFPWIAWPLKVIAFSIITLVQYRRGTNCGIC